MNANAAYRLGGIVCPVCGSDGIHVTDTRRRALWIARRRECKNGHRFTTHESIMVPVPPERRWQNELALAVLENLKKSEEL